METDAEAKAPCQLEASSDAARSKSKCGATSICRLSSGNSGATPQTAPFAPLITRSLATDDRSRMMTGLEMDPEEVKRLPQPLQLSPDTLLVDSQGAPPQPPSQKQVPSKPFELSIAHLITMKADPSNSKLARVFGDESEEEAVVRL
uniref:Uncharacterized protein n=1 Tax=Steinernema glaseri TaxID=37863 RepID=A0A1I8ALY2_9BILA